MKPGYEPQTTFEKLAWLVEELGEAQAAIGKTLRRGLDGSNPELTTDAELNGDWILRELQDVKKAIVIAEEALIAAMNELDGGNRK